MEKLNYTTVNHTARIELDLSIPEYCIADLIYNLSNNPTNDGWCAVSKEWMGQQLGMTKRNVNKIIVKLIKKNIIQVKEDKLSKSKGHHLKITFDWYNRVIIKGGNKSSHLEERWEQSVQKVGTNGPQGWEQSSHNKDINNKDINKLVPKGTTSNGELKRNGRNTDIDQILFHLKEKMEIPKLDLSEKVNRQYAWTLLRKSRTGVEGVKWLIDIASNDPWFKNHVTSMRDLWNNQVKIVAQRRGQSSKVFDATTGEGAFR